MLSFLSFRLNNADPFNFLRQAIFSESLTIAPALFSSDSAKLTPSGVLPGVPVFFETNVYLRRGIKGLPVTRKIVSQPKCYFQSQNCID